MSAWLVYLFGSGLIFFVGVGAILAAIGLISMRVRGKRIANLLVCFGLAAMVLSSTPLPDWYYLVALAASAAWLVTVNTSSVALQSRELPLRLLLVSVLTLGVAIEVPRQRLPTLKPIDNTTLYVFGDSLSAGLGGTTQGTWPRVLAQSHSLNLVDFSQEAATVAVAVKRASQASLDKGLVLLEIGGNDLLGSGSSLDFERRLRELLEIVCKPERQVVMFELPLPPLHNRYGQVQRRLCNQYGVGLIPKRVLMGVITREGATIDSIHLTDHGHQQLADGVWGILQPAYKSQSE